MKNGYGLWEDLLKETLLTSSQLYIEGKDGNLVEENEICACKPGKVELVCAVISPVPDKPCNTDNIFYR